MNLQTLRELRYSKNITLAELASNLPITEKRIKVLERELAKPTEDELMIFSQFYKIDLQEIKINRNEDFKVIGEGYVTAKTKEFQVFDPIISLEEDKKIGILDLFCGIGGLSYGFEQTGNFVTVAGLDLLEDRVKTFQLNHPHAYGFLFDIRKFTPNVIDKYLVKSPKVIVGGAPCQGFSSIRPFRTLSADDQRNNLFNHFAEYIDYFSPDWFVFENVIGLLTHKKGKTLQILLKEFASLGYRVDFKVLNSAYYGVPQLRERLIIVGNKKGVDFNFPKATHYFDDFRSMAGNRNFHIIKPDKLNGCKPTITVMDAISDLSPVESGDSSQHYIVNPQNEYQEYLRKESNELCNHDATKHSEKMIEIIKQSGYNIQAVKHLVTSGFSTCYSRLEPDRPSVTLTVNFVNPSSNKCIHPFQNRALTPREGARIQGFPDKFNFFGSRTQIVKQIGNAVPPILSKVIAEEIFKHY